MAKKTASELAETHRPKNYKYKYIFTDTTFVEELYDQGFDIDSLDTINDDDLVEDALKITDFKEFPRESVAKAKQPTILEDGVMLSKQMVTKTDKKLQSVQVGFFTHKNQRHVCIKLVYERFTIIEIFILV